MTQQLGVCLERKCLIEAQKVPPNADKSKEPLTAPIIFTLIHDGEIGHHDTNNF